MPFLKRLGLGSSTSSSSLNNKQPRGSSSGQLPTPPNSSISATQLNAPLPPTPPSSNRGSTDSSSSSTSHAASRIQSAASTGSDEVLAMHHRHIRSGSDSNASSAVQPSAEYTSPMEFVEEILDDYTHADQQAEIRPEQSTRRSVASPPSSSTARINAAMASTHYQHLKQPQPQYHLTPPNQQLSQDHGHLRTRSMPSLSSDEIQQLQQQPTPPTPALPSTVTDSTPQHDLPQRRSLRRPDSMVMSSQLGAHSTQRHSLPSRRVTLNPGATLSTSALQSILQPNPQERSASPAKSDKGRRNRNKTVSVGLVNANKWASRGGIGQKAEMMLDLETSGVFVPETGGRLRPDFVYNITTQCADEIRARGLTHPNLFHNPAPKKVINSMISLLTDRQRCDLFTIKCMRIDTVASLLLNTISRMSNPIIPYDMMDHFYGHQFTIVPASPQQSSSQASTPPLPEQQQYLQQTESSPSSSSSSSSSQQTSMGMTPSSSPRNSLVSPPTSTSGSPAGSSGSWSYQHPFYHYQQTTPFTTAWARHYFDLQSFLDHLPAVNRSILLEVLHLCQEVLEHASENLVTVASLSQIVSPALFSSVFDHKLLDRVAGTKRASIHGDGIMALEGVKQECQMFGAILVRFLVLTTAGNSNIVISPSSSPALLNKTMSVMFNAPHAATMMPTPTSSASTSTTSIPLQPQLPVDPAAAGVAAAMRTANRLSCPNMVTSYPVPISVATAKRTSMSPRPSVSEIRATQGVPLFRAEQESMRAEMQDHYQRMEQEFRELDIKRRSLPLLATAPKPPQEMTKSPLTTLAVVAHKDEGAYHQQVGGFVPDSNGIAQDAAAAGVMMTTTTHAVSGIKHPYPSLSPMLSRSFEEAKSAPTFPQPVSLRPTAILNETAKPVQIAISSAPVAAAIPATTV